MLRARTIRRELYRWKVLMQGEVNGDIPDGDFEKLRGYMVWGFGMVRVHISI